MNDEQKIIEFVLTPDREFVFNGKADENGVAFRAVDDRTGELIVIKTPGAFQRTVLIVQLEDTGGIRRRIPAFVRRAVEALKI